MSPPAPTQPDHLEALGVAVACLLPAIPAGWKAAGLRGDTFSKWSERVDVAHAGLTERAKDELLRLQDEIGRALGASLTTFSPSEVIADPEPLIAGATGCADILRARDKLRSRFRRHRRLGPSLLVAVALYVTGWVLATLHYTAQWRPTWVGIAGVVIAGAGAVGAIGLFIVYAVGESQLSSAEEMAAGDSA